MNLAFIFQIVLSTVMSVLGMDVIMAITPNGGVEGKALHIGGGAAQGKTDTLERSEGNDGNGDDYKPNALEEGVLKLRQGNYIIDTITRLGKNETVDSMKVEYYVADERKRAVTISGTVAAAAGTNNAGYQIYKFTVTNPNLVDQYSQLVACGVAVDNEGAGGNGTGINELSLFVETVNFTSGAVTAVAINGTGATHVIPTKALAALNSSKKLFNIGLAAPETQIISAPRSVMPISYVNYLQKFMSRTLQSRVSKETVNRAGWTPSDDDEYAVEEFKKDIEYSFIWGKLGVHYDTNAACNVWSTSGIIEQLIDKGGQVITYTSSDAITEEWINSTLESIFVGNSGADKRLLLVGPGFATAVANCSDIARQISATDTEISLGRTWKKWVSVHGELSMTVLPAFSLRGEEDAKWKNAALVLDPQYLSKKTLRSIERLSLDLRTSGVSDADSNVLMEISGVVLKNAKAHALIIPA